MCEKTIVRCSLLDLLRTSERFPEAAFISSFWFTFSAYSTEYVRKGEPEIENENRLPGNSL